MPQKAVAQELFGGLYTEARPEVLPQGASPRAINVDYEVGSVLPRPGKKSAYTYQNFEEALAGFVQSVTGPGAAWSGGSVTLNQAGGGGSPILLDFIGFNETIAGADAVWRPAFGGANLPGPIVVIWPIVTKCITESGTPTKPNGHEGSDAIVTGILDSVAGSWTELVGPTPWSQSSGSTDPGTLNNFQVFYQVFPEGTPNDYTITVSYAVDVTTLLATTSNPGANSSYGSTAIWVLNGQSLDQFASALLAPTPGILVSGARVTTTIEDIIFSISNLIGVFIPGFAPPPGTDMFHNDEATPGLADAVYGSHFGPLTLQPPGTYNPQWDYGSFTNPGPDTVLATAAVKPASGTSTPNVSQILQQMNFFTPSKGNLFPVNIPQGPEATGCGDTFGFMNPTEIPIYGVEVLITGDQSSLSPDAVITVQLQLGDGTLSPEIDTVQLPLTTPGTITLGSPTDLWGLDLTAAELNDPDFSVLIIASATGGEQVTFTVSQVQVNVFTPPFNAVTGQLADINYLKTFAQTGGEIENLFLGSDGTLYGEDVVNDPGVLLPLFTNIQPESFAQSVTLDDREYIAVSNLLNGTDIPRTYTGPTGTVAGYLDRLSQVGPGAPPSVSTTTAGSAVVNITQNPVFNIPTSTGGTSGAWVLWSDSPRDQGSFGLPNTPGNVLTIIFPVAVPLPSYLTVGSNIVLKGFQVMNGYNPNNGVGGNPDYYTITSIGQPDPSQSYYDAFTVTVPNSGFYNARIQAGATFQATIATMTTAQPVINLEVGGQFELTGTGGAPPAGYDGTWTVVDSPNAAQLQITSTSLTNNVATYSYDIITGGTPAVGELVTVAQTLNGGGIFNVSNAVIVAAGPGTFSINLVGANVAAAAETGTGLIFGTIFTFDPFTIVGNTTGGTVVTTGQITPGQRKVCYSFLTRNGFITQPSPIDTADIIEGANGIAVANIATGPPNVVARIVHFTAADGGQFYNIPEPVIVIDPITGQTLVNTSTWIMDNTSTGATFSFSDSVLLAADEVDIQGNNLFECFELGSCVGFIEYAGRLAAIGEQNKVFNFRNMSFDGGVGTIQGNQGAGGDAGSANQTYPLGWTIDPNAAFGFGGSVVASPIFGMAYQISNNSGSVQGVYGDIWQNAYQDEFQVPIINPNVTYSVRVTAAVAAAVASGNLVISLFSPDLNNNVGEFDIPLSSLTTGMQIVTGTLLTTPLTTIPQKFFLRIYAQNIPNGASVLVDRIEVFPTEQPNLSNQIILSYANNFESFDRLTGVLQPVDNPQPIRSCFELFDTLYMTKTGSIFSTNDNGTTEPSVSGGGWVIRTVSQSVGTNSIYGVTAAQDQPNTGEDWAIIAGRAGLYIYGGGEPVKLSEEIQKLWNTINWQYGHTIWVLNDIIQRRILVGVPLKTFTIDPFGNTVRNTWLPAGFMPDNGAPTTPNCILELNYRQLNTEGALAAGVGVHRSFSGKLLDSEITRKWAIWTIKAPAAAFLTKQDGTNPVFFGNSDDNGKVFQLTEGYYEDDNGPYAEDYVTSPFLPRQDAQAQQVDVLRVGFSYMNIILNGEGACRLTVWPNTMDSPYAHRLLPDLALPASTNGDVEVPVDEEASRLFVEFGAQCVGSWFILSGLVMMMAKSAFSPFRGMNN